MNQTTESAPQQTVTETSAEENKSSGFFTFERVVIGIIIGLVGIYLLIFLAGLGAAIIWGESAVTYFAYFRSLLLIILTVTSVIIIISIGILIVQVARLINLIRSEIQPLAEDTKQVVKTVQNTTQFVQKQAVEPIIQTHSFVAGLLAFLREIVRITQMLQHTRSDSTEVQTETDENQPSI